MFVFLGPLVGHDSLTENKVVCFIFMNVVFSMLRTILVLTVVMLGQG